MTYYVTSTPTWVTKNTSLQCEISLILLFAGVKFFSFLDTMLDLYLKIFSNSSYTLPHSETFQATGGSTPNYYSFHLHRVFLIIIHLHKIGPYCQVNTMQLLTELLMLSGLISNRFLPTLLL